MTTLSWVFFKTVTASSWVTSSNDELFTYDKYMTVVIANTFITYPFHSRKCHRHFLPCPTPDEWKGYYIDNDKIPRLFRWRKNNFYLSHVKISRLSWLLVSTNKRLILSWYFIYVYIINRILYVCLCIWILNFLYSTWTLEDKIHIYTLACDISKNK